MTLPFYIRPACVDDFEAMAPLWQQLDEFHHKQDPLRFPKQNNRTPRDLSYVSDLIERPDRVLLVAESSPLHEDEEARLMGLCTVLLRSYAAGPVFPARVVFEIDNVVVDEAMRRRGVARSLIRESEAWSRAQGAGEVILNVYNFNNQARSFYEQVGFLSSKTQMVRALY
ncbi:GNAT family N-acetyltransferase [Cohaesibacter celericrescens]|uniref:GNAT family N-acetyltransferase n=1 Tax=Cohaesibacter celericrescens TaxID=2067669 RepID=UPI0011AED617|nr:GNAT family N-acetyltransferase [Cohaesibacter celericrescens]